MQDECQNAGGHAMEVVPHPILPGQLRGGREVVHPLELVHHAMHVLPHAGAGPANEPILLLIHSELWVIKSHSII